jgi:hypothetical protein
VPVKRVEKNEVDLSVLYKNVKDRETVYRLTELYIPWTEEQRKSMVAFNRDQMRSQNDEDGELFKKTGLRLLKEQVKKRDLKETRDKIRHQIKYCTVPGSLNDDIQTRYRPGMTTRDIKRANKYERYPHIARIVPSKRPIDSNTLKLTAQRLESQMSAAKAN